MMVQHSAPAAYTEPATPSLLTTWRCWRCGRIIARLFLLPGCSVEIKCKCNAVNVAKVDNMQAAT